MTDPFASNHGGTIRTRALIRILQAANFEVRVISPIKAAGEAKSAQLGSPALGEAERRYARFGPLANSVANLKRTYLPMPTRLGASSQYLRSEVVAAGSSLILVSVIPHVQYANLLDNFVWQDFMDLWGEFGRREAQSRSGFARLTAGSQAKLIQRRERAAAKSADLVTVTGWRDWEILSSEVDAIWLPTPLPDSDFCYVEKRESADKTAGFIGNFEYWPNRDALDVLLTHWLPELRRLGWKVVVAGRGLEKTGSPPDGVEYLGEVAHTDEFYGRIAVSLAPIRLGGGMKVKVLESLSKGVPVIGTKFALEGFSPEVQQMCITAEMTGSNLASISELTSVDPYASSLDPYRLSYAIRTMGDALRQHDADVSL
ncbi:MULTISPECIES: glycosyltransferase family 4 protein [Rhodococcus]|uniref:Glycosyltransferase family 4 protein n=1 Tax=Rhodococcus oxybenzonivorans TaxID=1990687 RepID=A0AAE4V226_9NOCA|nr:MULTISPECIES: glycosyltransferase family 4 protein [Rhodococcus]MDV7243719.1 glycosyltransferase family 4 protein [Rhodococcus oxybenzonivorans]MDV7267193.1 glycosyltransferase family 4 protein [Rhodococcus oxybenzonivorans]MDV7275039.1 glycosyltransferase family 4 protein [Rhodococcus oxybenzonivorans]MDV7335277.1 glycosyltransferase family 4 protein [Rhodococcus oxybenzonivorans]MDV7345988.1 glycosyltransferase family 4 protein [Rhodococcus oxybenzonivorans]